MEYLTKIETFAKKFDVLVFVVAHPTKMYKDKEGKMEEPNMYNIKGGKVKFQNLGENGAEAHFKWEPKSGCFIPHEPVSINNEPMPWE
jgi:twinkle protein